MKEIQKVHIIGMGALGLLYGKMILDHCGADAVSFCMDETRYQKNQGQKFLCNGEEVVFPMLKASQATPADLVIVAVKYTGLESALEVMKNSVGEDTIIISVLNGISSERIIGEKFGYDNIIYTVAQGMDAMKFGNNLSYTKAGELRVGMTKQTKKDNLISLELFFQKAGIPYVEETDILYRMWGKFMLNVGINQTCMVYDTNYVGALKAGEANRTLVAAMREVIAIANAEQIALSEKDLNQYIDIIKTLSPEGVPSMGQDRMNRKKSEVDLFAGTVMAIAKKHGIYVPTNEYLYQKVQEIEAQY